MWKGGGRIVGAIKVLTFCSVCWTNDVKLLRQNAMFALIFQLIQNDLREPFQKCRFSSVCIAIAYTFQWLRFINLFPANNGSNTSFKNDECLRIVAQMFILFKLPNIFSYSKLAITVTFDVHMPVIFSFIESLKKILPFTRIQ